MRKHGTLPRGLEAAGQQKAAGPLANTPFGVSRFGRLFDASATSFSDANLDELAKHMVAEFDPPRMESTWKRVEYPRSTPISASSSTMT